MTIANPSVDPANNDTLVGTFRQVIVKMLQSVDDMLPARVVNFDRTTNLAQVQPLIAMVSTSGEQVTRAQVASIPVLQLGGGNCLLNFNLVPGDLGWIKANDRDISLFLQSFSNSSPNTFRLKNFADSVFIPHVMMGYTIDDEDTNNAVLQTKDGTVRVALWADKIKMTAPNIILDSDVEITKTLTVTGLTSVNGGLAASGGTGATCTITGNQHITGDQRVDGDITAGGSITPDVP